jgi:uncharacterized protein (DUF1810 family)
MVSHRVSQVDIDLPFVIGKLAGRLKARLSEIVFPDIIPYYASKPAAFYYMLKGNIKQVKNKEKLAYTDLGKGLVEREKEVVAEQTQRVAKVLGESAAAKLVCENWRICYRGDVVEYINTTKLVANFGKSKVGRLSKDVHYVIRDVPKFHLSCEHMIRYTL